MLDIVFIIVGAVLIIKGADIMTDGAAGIARRLGMSQLVIGLTIVAMGTSAPELFVSLMSAIKGKADLAVGNVVGSNIVNTLVIVGVTATIAPLNVLRRTVIRDIPVMVAASFAMLFMGLDGQFSRADCAILFVGFISFIIYTVSHAKTGDADEQTNAKKMAIWKAILFVLIGLGCLVGGGQLFVDGASGIARSLGVSDAIIGLTIVAIGTSLPELAASIVAARKGQGDMAIGNVIGSNIFNILFVIGLPGIIAPMHINGVTMVDMTLMVACPVLFWFFSRTRYKIERWEGWVLTLIYVVYVVWLITNL